MSLLAFGTSIPLPMTLEHQETFPPRRTDRVRAKDRVLTGLLHPQDWHMGPC